MADDIVVGSVAVDIVPDTKNFRRDLNAKLQGITVDVGIKADTTGVRAELDDLTRTRDMRIVANADVAEANAQLDLTARDRESTIRANVDASQVAAVGSLSRGLGGVSAGAAALITLGPALIPILAALAGVGAALAAPLAIAGGGATVFGFLAGFAVKDTVKQLKDIDKLDAKLSTLKKGTKEYADTQAELKAKQDALSPSQKKFADSLDHIKGTFATLLGGKVGGQLLGPVSAFLNLTADVLPRLAPIIGAVSDALSDLLGDLGKAVKGPDFKAFVTTFSEQVGPDIEAFGHIAGNVFKGVAGLVVSLGDAFGPGLLKGIENLTGKFAALGDQGAHSQKLQDFVNYFHRVGPQVGDTIGAVARAVGHVVTALAPLGPPALKAVEGISNAISSIPVPVLTGMAGAFGAMVLASKASKGLSGALGLLGGGGGLGRSGGILGLVGKVKPVPVFVTNPGFGTPGAGGPKAVPINPKTGLPFAEGATAEAEAIRAAKAAAEAVKLAGGSVAAQSSAAGRAFKEAMAAHDAAVFKTALDFGVKGGVRGLLGTIFAAPAAISLNHDTGQSVEPNFDVNNVGDLHDFLKATGQLDRPLKATTSHFDALKASAEDASRTIDQIGPHADHSFGQASRDVADFSKKLDAIHDKKVRVLLDDLAAVQSLKALQALRLKDKTLTIHVEQEFDRVVGPGGGIGHPLGGNGGGASRGNDVRVPSSRSGDSGAGAPVQIDKAFFTDTNDVLRKADRRQRRRAGGAVVFPTARVTDFAGSR